MRRDRPAAPAGRRARTDNSARIRDRSALPAARSQRRSRLASGLCFDAALEQMDGREIARVLQRAPQGESAPDAAVVVLRRPVIPLAGAAAADRRQRDRLVADQRVGLQALAQRRQIAQRLDGGARLAHRLGRAIELAQRIGEAAGHGEDAAGLVLQHDHRALHDRPHAQLGARAPLALALAHADQDHVVERELALRGGVVDRERHDAPVGEPDAPRLALLAAPVSPARRRASSARRRAAAARSRAPAARPAACRRPSCRLRCVWMACERFASAPRNWTRPALRS